MQRSTSSKPARTRLVAGAFIASLAMLGASCAPASPPAGGGGLDIDLGPLTIPLPPIEVRAPATQIPVLLCNVGYQPPGVQIRNATVTIPRVRIDPARPVISVPNVRVTIPQLRVPLSTLTLSCGPIAIPVSIDLIIPSTVTLTNATVDLNARTITLQQPTLTINGAGLGVSGLDLVVPLPPIVNVPLQTTAIAF